MIRFEHVSKRFGSLDAISDITFEIARGEFVFLIGPSGAGKTTILRQIIHDLLPSKGKILVNALDVGNLPQGKIFQLRRSVGMIFQDFKLLTDRDRKSTRLNSSHIQKSRMPSSA